MHQKTYKRIVLYIAAAIDSLVRDGKLSRRSKYACLITDVDGTFGKWQLLLSLLVAIAEEKSEKRHALCETLDKISEYQMCRIPFHDVMRSALEAVPLAMEGLSSDFIRRLSDAITMRDATLIYRLPGELVKAIKSLDPDMRLLMLSVTGAPQFIAEPFCRELGLDTAVGVEYFVDAQGRFTGERDETPAIRKAEVMDVLDGMGVLDLQNSVGMGDTMSDLPIFEKVHPLHRLAINPKPELLTHMRANPDKNIVFVSDHRSTGVQFYRADALGRLGEVHRSDAIPISIVNTVLPLVGEKPLCVL